MHCLNVASATARYLDSFAISNSKSDREREREEEREGSVAVLNDDAASIMCTGNNNLR